MFNRRLRKQLLSSTLSVGIIFLCSLAAEAQGQKASVEKEWEQTVQNAKKEGQLVFHSDFEFFFSEFHQKYPEIKLTKMLSKGGSATVQRLMAERRAGGYTTDVLIMGGTSGTRLIEAGALDPIPPILILPEIVDQSKWWQGSHLYADREGKYLFVFAMAPQPDIGYNRTLVSPDNLSSYWDLLDPKWKGKMVTMDPAEGRGTVGSSLRFMYYNPKLGPDFMRKLLGGMDLTPSRDGRQITDWLATGKFAISVLTTPDLIGLDQAKKQGLPVDWFGPAHFKEGVALSGGGNNVLLVNKAPHPNAAKLFVNWFLSREGQAAAQRGSARNAGGIDSLRNDIPKNDVPPEQRRQAGLNYFYTDKPEWMDMKPVVELIGNVWGKRDKK